ncbi:Uncharacterised protein [Serratia liquefaciens]|uniref:hypothetical protein n=1 Tax=Serratia liquefaciens TaxID=614 RepID=UPI002177611E|nr:hypothetical protein [Serratia liquefaciens]CAI0959382.1 Uncharacterised protein [Serratia liquefaciens]CAI1125078.1 Uncharacterised protein [Serratia liquefaciens]
MYNKQNVLKDVADYWRKVKSGELPAPGPNEISITVCTLDGAVSRIAALLAELEAKDKRIAELENDLGLKHIRAVEEALIFATDRNSELEAKLATPVRLSDSTHPRCRLQHADDIRAAGFTVESDI